MKTMKTLSFLLTTIFCAWGSAYSSFYNSDALFVRTHRNDRNKLELSVCRNSSKPLRSGQTENQLFQSFSPKQCRTAWLDEPTFIQRKVQVADAFKADLMDDKKRADALKNIERGPVQADGRQSFTVMMGHVRYALQAPPDIAITMKEAARKGKTESLETLMLELGENLNLKASFQDILKLARTPEIEVGTQREFETTVFLLESLMPAPAAASAARKQGKSEQAREY